MTRIQISFINAVLFVVMADAVAWAATEVTLREKVATAASVVRLGDISDITDVNRERARRLEATPLIPAPAPGAQRFLRQREIQDLLAARGVDVRDLRIKGAEQVTISAAATRGRDRKDASGSEANSARNRHAALLSGHVVALGVSKIDPARSGEPAQTPVLTPVVVAVQPIARGAVFTAAQLEVRNINYVPKASDRRVAIDAIEKLIGMEARQAIQTGAVVFSDQVQPPVLVKRGELVTVSSQASGIRVRTTARAREDGVQGQLVQVESPDTRERFEARIVGRREAAIVALTTPEVSRSSERIQTALRSSVSKRIGQ